MILKYNYTINEIIKRPLFKNARVVAGKKGLSRVVQWVHILQVAEVDTLLSGREMVLTTGAGLKKGSEYVFLRKLIKQGASCLCIEFGNYFKSIPNQMLEIANEHNFPLIVFYKTVRFIDLTQDIHSLLINRHHKTLESFIHISREFQQLTLSSHSTFRILKLLHNKTTSKVAFLPVGEEGLFIPEINNRERGYLNSLVKKLKKNFVSTENNSSEITSNKDNQHFLIHPIGASGQSLGHLCLIISEREPEELDYLLLDSASTAIAQDLLRRWYLEERKNTTEQLWVEDIIHNRVYNLEQVEKWFPPKFNNERKTYRVCLIELENKNENDVHKNDKKMFQTHFKILVRNEFKAQGFHLLTTIKNNLLIMIIVDLKHDEHDQKRKIKEILSTNLFTGEESIYEYRKTNFAIGRSYDELSDIHNSYNEALRVLMIHKKTKHLNSIFYEDLGIYQILLKNDNDLTIKQFIDDTIGPLIKYDQIHKGQLLNTLKVLLENDGSKMATAEALYVVRQTVYYRLKKIKDLLGENFMSPDKRLAIEVALQAYYLNKNETY